MDFICQVYRNRQLFQSAVNAEFGLIFGSFVMGQRTRKAQGFTLIELLVVISIIALLLSILVPSLSRVKEMARRTRCRSNFHSIGISFSMYAAGNNNVFPPQFAGLDTPPKTIGKTPMFIVDSFYRMMKDDYGYEPAVLVCPSWKGDSVWGRSSSPGPYTLKDLFGRGELPGETEQDLLFVTWNDNYWPDGRLMGVFFLHSLWFDEERPVPTSPQRPTDRGDKVLGADMNMYWENPARIWSAHYKKDVGRLPEGTNRLYLDGSVVWWKSEKMARDDQPLTLDETGSWEGEYRFSHWSGEMRRYYW